MLYAKEFAKLAGEEINDYRDQSPTFTAKAIVRELMLRSVLMPPALRPRFIQSVDAIQRLNSIKEKTTVLDLVSARIGDGEDQTGSGHSGRLRMKDDPRHTVYNRNPRSSHCWQRFSNWAVDERYFAKSDILE